MSRLTEKDANGNWKLKRLKWSDFRECNLPKETREAIYGALWKLLDYEETGLNPEHIYNMDMLYAKKCEEVAECKKAMQWIPVEEQLPEDETAVLATVRHRRWICDYDLGESEWYEHPEYYEVCTVYRDGDEYCKMDDSDYDNISHIPVADQEEDIAYPIEEVVAWMPLPEPYKKDGDAG